VAVDGDDGTVVTLFVVAYVLLTLGLLAFELVAVFNEEPGDTITENTKRFLVLQSMMSGLLVWALWHFVGDDIWPGPAWVDLIFLGIGATLGATAWVVRTRRK
jgi:hypothetical protein